MNFLNQFRLRVACFERTNRRGRLQVHDRKSEHAHFGEHNQNEEHRVAEQRSVAVVANQLRSARYDARSLQTSRK